MEKIVVTGGAGFIGSHLVEKLLAEKFEVIVIDDFSTGNEENLSVIENSENLKVVFGDCANENTISEALDGASTVFHLAARVGVQRVIESPLATLDLNMRLTRVVANAAMRADAKMILASTSEVYGRNEKVPFSEEDDLTLGPPNVGRWSYAASKILDEHLLLALGREKGLRVTIARLFNSVGTYQLPDYGMVIPRFVTASLTKRPLTVYGDGKQRRCFTWVKDTVDGLFSISRKDSCLGEVYNIGSNFEISIVDLARKIIEMTGSGSIQYVDESTLGKNYADMHRRIPDITKISNAVGWNPKVEIDEILRKTIKWWKTKNLTLMSGNL